MLAEGAAALFERLCFSHGRGCRLIGNLEIQSLAVTIAKILNSWA
jgi:hypothetical protein